LTGFTALTVPLPPFFLAFSLFGASSSPAM
jgi:hypothetical protein